MGSMLTAGGSTGAGGSTETGLLVGHGSGDSGGLADAITSV